MRNIFKKNYFPLNLQLVGYNRNTKEVDFSDYLGYTNEELQNISEDDLLSVVPVIKNKYRYKYQGQERQDELNLNWDSFKWRNYDYAIGRFMSVDPLSEEYHWQTVYAFASNEVVVGPELEGMENPEGVDNRNRTKDSDGLLTQFMNGLKGIHKLINGEGKIISKYDNLPDFTCEQNCDGSVIINYNRASFFGVPYQSSSTAAREKDIKIETDRLQALEVGVRSFEIIDAPINLTSKVILKNTRTSNTFKLPISATKNFDLTSSGSFKHADPNDIKSFLHKEGWEISNLKNTKKYDGFKANLPGTSKVITVEKPKFSFPKNSTVPDVKRNWYMKYPQQYGSDIRIPLRGNSEKDVIKIQ